jgi:hypothetical protein
MTLPIGLLMEAFKRKPQEALQARFPAEGNDPASRC